MRGDLRGSGPLPTVTTLANGLRVATDPLDGVETASVGLWIEAGARDETPHINGASHFLEHMMFKGTPTRSAYQIVEEIETVGGHINAYTSRENTAFYAKILAEDLPLAVDVIADIVENATIDTGEFERERQVILQEIHQAQDTPDDIIFDHFQEAAFPDQPLGMPVLGTTEGVTALARDAVADHKQQHYAPHRMVLAAAGAVDHDALVEMADRLLSRPTGDAPPTRPTASYTGGDIRIERDLEQVHVVMGLEAPGLAADDHDAAAVFATLMGGGMSSRLFQEIREERGLAYSIHAYLSAYDDTGIFTVYAGTSQSDVAELVPVVCEEMMKSTRSIPEDEIERAKAQLRAGTLMARESTSARCEHLARHLMTFGRPIPVEETKARIAAVDAAAIRAVAERIVASSLTVAATGPLANLETFEATKARLV